MSDLEIVLVDPLDQELVDQWLAVRKAAQEADVPDLPWGVPGPSIVGLVRQVSYQRTEHWVARQQGQVVGAAQIDLFLRDNRHLAEVDLLVAPAHRRRGLGTALRDHVEQRVAAQGRDTIHAYLVDPIDGGPPRPVHGQRFAEASGYARGLDEIRRTVDLAAVDEAAIDQLLAQAWQHADGYELVQWAGTKPADILDGTANLLGRLTLDAPIG
jgi:GNAT superfamily N-acetyltransferase